MVFSRHPATAMLAAGIAAALLTTAPAAVLAREAAPAAKQSRSAARGDDVETRIKELHRKLRITAEQEPAWNDVAQIMRENATRMKELRDARAKNEASMTAVDELNTYASVVDAHADNLHKMVAAFQKLYDEMSPEQKKTADAVFHERVREAAQRHRP